MHANFIFVMCVVVLGCRRRQDFFYLVWCLPVEKSKFLADGHTFHHDYMCTKCECKCTKKRRRDEYNDKLVWLMRCDPCECVRTHDFFVIEWETSQLHATLWWKMVQIFLNNYSEMEMHLAILQNSIKKECKRRCIELNTFFTLKYSNRAWIIK